MFSILRYVILEHRPRTSKNRMLGTVFISTIFINIIIKWNKIILVKSSVSVMWLCVLYTYAYVVQSCDLFCYFFFFLFRYSLCVVALFSTHFILKINEKKSSFFLRCFKLQRHTHNTRKTEKNGQQQQQ